MWLRRETMVMMELGKELRGGIYLTIDEVAPHGEEPVEFLVNDEVFFQAVEMKIPARPGSGFDERQSHSGWGPKTDDEKKR